MQKIDEGYKQIVSLQYYKKQNIELTENSDKTVSIVFSFGDWIELYSTLFTIEFSEDSNNTANGIIYKQNLSFTFLGDDKIINTEMSDILNYPLILKLNYQDGTSKILGDNQNTCTITKNFKASVIEATHSFLVERMDYKPAAFLSL